MLTRGRRDILQGGVQPPPMRISQRFSGSFDRRHTTTTRPVVLARLHRCPPPAHYCTQTIKRSHLVTCDLWCRVLVSKIGRGGICFYEVAVKLWVSQVCKCGDCDLNYSALHISLRALFSLAVFVLYKYCPIWCKRVIEVTECHS